MFFPCGRSAACGGFGGLGAEAGHRYQASNRHAQPSDDLDAITAEASEHETLATALDELGLEFGGSGLEDLDNGELWQVIEKERRRRAATGEMLEKYSKPM